MLLGMTKQREKKGEKEGKRERNAVILFLKYKRKTKTNKRKQNQTTTASDIKCFPWQPVVQLSLLAETARRTAEHGAPGYLC